jgi:hypothetical protein
MLPMVNEAIEVLKSCEEDIDKYPQAIREARKNGNRNTSKAAPSVQVDKTVTSAVTETRVEEKADSEVRPQPNRANTKESQMSNQSVPSGSNGYWDDYCLAYFLKGVCLRYAAFPVSLFLKAQS